MKLSFLVSLMAWASVFILGNLAVLHKIHIDSLLSGYWIFCLVIALSGGLAYSANEN